MKAARLTLISTFAALSATWVDAGSVSAAIFTVGGQQYDITTFQGSYTVDGAKFNTASNGGSMPWWGNSSLANDFATAVQAGLGLPNCCTLGPFFAHSADVNFIYLSYWESGALTNNKTFNFFSDTYAQATLYSPPNSVPGPYRFLAQPLLST